MMGEVQLQEKPEIASQQDPPWEVVIHDDPVNLMGYVTLVIRRVFGYDEARAQRHMLEVHHEGSSVVWVGEREQAEFYVHQLHQHQLKATLEQSEE